MTLVSGGRVQYRRGTLEFHGGFSRWLARLGGFQAMTLGHAIIGHDARALDHCRAGHVSAEAGHRALLQALKLDQLLDLGMRLGEA